MKSIIYFLLICISISCTNYKEQNQILKDDIKKEKKENQRLMTVIKAKDEEIKKLKMTDQGFFSEAIEFEKKGDNVTAIEKLNELKEKFPTSMLKGNVNKKIMELNKKESEIFNNLKDFVSKQDIEISIQTVNNYIKESRPAIYIHEANIILNNLNEKYETIKIEKQAEKLTGFRIESITSEWTWRGNFGNKLLVPSMKITLRNISDFEKESLHFKVVFINTDKNEIFDDVNDSLIGHGDVPLRPGLSKTGFIYGNVGYRGRFAAINLPNLTAEIYINKELYKKITMSKETREY